jgi:hypothetical protein
VAFDRRLENALQCFGRVVRAFAATQSFVHFNSFYLCTISCRADGHPVVRNFTPAVQKTAYAGGR